MYERKREIGKEVDDGHGREEEQKTDTGEARFIMARLEIRVAEIKMEETSEVGTEVFLWGAHEGEKAMMIRKWEGCYGHSEMDDM